MDCVGGRATPALTRFGAARALCPDKKLGGYLRCRAVSAVGAGAFENTLTATIFSLREAMKYSNMK
jgi:hypothetical protein